MEPEELRKINKEPGRRWHKKLVRLALATVFCIAVALIAFWGVQWFSASLENLLLHKSTAFLGSLEAAANNAPPPAAAISEVPAVQRSDAYQLPYRNWRMPAPDIQAEAALSVEIGGPNPKVLFNKNEQKKLPVASLTKLMTALVALENYDLEQKTTISQNSMAIEGEQGNLAAGQVLSVKDLLYIMLIESSNRAAYALAEIMGNQTFVDMMNIKAQALGLANTHFQDSSGLDARSYSTAGDILALSEHVFENYPLLANILSTKEYPVHISDGSIHHVLQTTNQLLGRHGIIAGKTGYTYDAKGCMMVLSWNGDQTHYVITVVLGAQDRFLETEKIIDWIEQAYAWK